MSNHPRRDDGHEERDRENRGVRNAPENAQHVEQTTRHNMLVMALTERMGCSIEDPGKAIGIPERCPKGIMFHADVSYPGESWGLPTVIRFHETVEKFSSQSSFSQSEIEEMTVWGALAVQVLQGRSSPLCSPLKMGFLKYLNPTRRQFITEFFNMSPRKDAPEDAIRRVTLREYGINLEINQSKVWLVKTPKSNILRVLTKPHQNGSHLIIVKTGEDVKKVERMIAEGVVYSLRENVLRPPPGTPTSEWLQMTYYLMDKGLVKYEDLNLHLRVEIDKAKNKPVACHKWETLHRNYLPTVKVTTFQAWPSVFHSLGPMMTVQIMNTSWPILTPILVRYSYTTIGIVGSSEEDLESVPPRGEMNLMKLNYPMLDIPI